VARALCVLNAMDYACFDHLLSIPPFCQQVYNEESFVEKLLSSSS